MTANGVCLFFTYVLLSVLASSQGSARASAREAQGSRGHARRDGPHPHRHSGGGADRAGAVETATPQVVQCKCKARWSPAQVCRL